MARLDHCQDALLDLSRWFWAKLSIRKMSDHLDARDRKLIIIAISGRTALARAHRVTRPMACVAYLLVSVITLSSLVNQQHERVIACLGVLAMLAAARGILRLMLIVAKLAENGRFDASSASGRSVRQD